MDAICLLIFVLGFINFSAQKPHDFEKPRKNDFPISRIIGGSIVSPHSIPYQVLLNFIEGDNTWSCGGSLITTNYVLTAGRCSRGASSVEVILGSHNISEEESTQIKLESSDITIHPNFKTDGVTYFVYENDISLIQLPNPVTLNEAIQTIKLPSSNNIYANETGIVSGWGLTDSYNSTSYSSVLLSQQNTIITNEECSHAYYDLKDYDICMLTSDTASPCVGDYGSPLVVNNVQVGIVSQGMMFCIPGYPFIYTRVSSFLEWILENSDYEDNGDDTTITIPTTSTTEETVTTASSSSISTSASSPITSSAVDTTTVTVSTTTGSAHRVTQSLEVYALVITVNFFIVKLI